MKVSTSSLSPALERASSLYSVWICRHEVPSGLLPSAPPYRHDPKVSSSVGTDEENEPTEHSSISTAWVKLSMLTTKTHSFLRFRALRGNMIFCLPVQSCSSLALVKNCLVPIRSVLSLSLAEEHLSSNTCLNRVEPTAGFLANNDLVTRSG